MAYNVSLALGVLLKSRSLVDRNVYTAVKYFNYFKVKYDCIDSYNNIIVSGKKEEATRVLKFLRASQTQAEEEIKEYDANYNVGEVKIKHLLKSKPVVKALIIVIIIGIGTQATGYNAVTFYLQTVLESTKTSVSSELASVIIGIVQLISCLCTIVVSDRFGRKPIICTGLVGMSVGLVSLNCCLI